MHATGSASDRDVQHPDRWSSELAHLRHRHLLPGSVDYVGGPGDSIVEGVGASSRSNTWWSVFADEMAAALGQSSRAIRSAEVTESSRWSIWSHTGPPPYDSALGLGKYSLALLPGTLISTVQACDAIRLHYSRTHEMFGAAGGSLTVRVDSDTLAVLECGGADDALSLEWVSPPLEFGLHTVTLECSSGAFALVDHAYFHDGDAETGARFWRCGHNRYNAGDETFGFADPESGWMGAFTRRSVVAHGTKGTPVVGSGAIEPDCFLISTGTNDIELWENDRTRIASGYERQIRYIRARCDTSPSIGIVVPTSSTRYGGQYQPLLDGATDACLSEGAFLVDLWSALGTHADDSCGFFFDGLHPNDRGHRAWGEYLAAWMLEAIGVRPRSA